MGLLDKIFSSGGAQSTVVDTVDVSDVAPTAKYKEKYTQMEADGKKISWYEYEKSIDQGWPYPVATEGEMDQIEHLDKQALRGHAPDITALINAYHNGIGEDANDPEYTIFKDEDKEAYWKNKLVEGAEQGNRTFQAALIATNGYGGILNGWISQEEFEGYEAKYKDRLIQDAEDGVPEAQYAVAEFCLGDAVYQSDLRREYADAAMRAGITDAAYLRGEIYKWESYNNNGSWEYGDILQFYAYVKDNETGSMLGYMQDCVAEGYRDGEGSFPKDRDRAIYYYNLAIKNGSSSAKSTMELAERHPEILG